MISKREMKQLIQNREDVIIKQLVKCFIYKDSLNKLDKWKRDINKELKWLPKLKPFCKYPTYKQLEKWTIKHFKEDLDYRIHKIILDLELDDYPKMYDKLNHRESEKLSYYIIKYYNCLINELVNNNGYVDSKFTIDTIDNLILEYGKDKNNYRKD